MIITTMKARAYVNWSRWVADCPMACGGALALDPGQTVMHCAECGHLAEVDWPPEPQGIWDALMIRPIPKTRNWFPEDHDLAVRAGCPHGQSVADLREETRAYIGDSG